MGAWWWYRDDLRKLGKLGKLEVDSHRDMGRGTERVSGYGACGVVVGRYVAKVVVGSVGGALVIGIMASANMGTVRVGGIGSGLGRGG